MAEAGLMGAWVGKYVTLRADDYGWVGVLDGWDDRGVLLRLTEEALQFHDRGEAPATPALIFFPWARVQYVSVDLREDRF